MALNLYVPSLLNFYWWSDRFPKWQWFIGYIVSLHKTVVGPFTRRPVTTFLIEGVNAIFFLSLWHAFLLVQGSLLIAAALALGGLAKRLHGTRAAHFSIFVFFASFSVLFSFITPNDSYDEPAQYLFLFFSLLFLGRNSAAFAASFFCALLARESSVLLLPGLLILDEARFTPKYLRKSWKFLLPLAGYAAFFFFQSGAEDPQRFQYWQKNFSDLQIAGESLVSLALALALPLLLYWPVRQMKAVDPIWMRAFLVSAAINSPIILLAAYARETRLFSLPLIFLWPHCGSWMEKLFAGFREQELLAFAHQKVVFLFLGFLTLAIFFYHPSYRSAESYRAGLFLTLGIGLFFGSLSTASPPK